MNSSMIKLVIFNVIFCGLMSMSNGIFCANRNAPIECKTLTFYVNSEPKNGFQLLADQGVLVDLTTPFDIEQDHDHYESHTNTTIIEYEVGRYRLQYANGIMINLNSFDQSKFNVIKAALKKKRGSATTAVAGYEPEIAPDKNKPSVKIKSNAYYVTGVVPFTKKTIEDTSFVLKSLGVGGGIVIGLLAAWLFFEGKLTQLWPA